MKKILAYFGYYPINEHASTYTYWTKEKNKFVMYVISSGSVKRVGGNEFIEDIDFSEMAHFGIHFNDSHIMESYNNGVPPNPISHSAIIPWYKMGDKQIKP